MYGWDTLVLLKHYLESGLSKTAIARQLGVSRRPIYHWITTGQLDREVTKTAAPRRRASCGTRRAMVTVGLRGGLRALRERLAVTILLSGGSGSAVARVDKHGRGTAT